MYRCQKVMIIFVMLFLIYSTVEANIINVPSEVPTLQAGINLAEAGDTVLAAEGIYSGSDNYNLNFVGKDIVLMSEKGAEFTTIDCGGLGRAIAFLNHETSESKLIGFNIINGHTEDVGGAIYCDTAAPTIMDCIFSDNSTKVRGGAIYATNESHIQVLNCKFYNNSAESYGGGLYIHWGSDAIVKNCLFDGNSATHAGAFMIDKSTPTVMNNIFIHNMAEDIGGAIFIQDDCQSTIMNCTFVNNTAVNGAAVFTEERYDYWPVSLTISNCIITESKGDDPIVQKLGELNIYNTDIYGNEEGDWIGSIEGHLGNNNNFSLDPKFCDREIDDYHLYSHSPCAPENNITHELIGALPVGCYQFTLDIKPGSCPNPLNIKIKKENKKSVLPVAILGSAGADVNDIDVSSITLLGVSPIRYSFEDVGTQFDNSGSCECSSKGMDEYLDLTLKFYRNDIIEHIPEDAPLYGEFSVTLNGKLKDGTEFLITDCLLLKNPGDVNNSGNVSIDDLIIVVDYFFHNGSISENIVNADMNDDTVLDIADLLKLVDYIFQ